MDKVKRSVDGGFARWTLGLEQRLSYLNAREITKIDDLLAAVAPFGDVRLAVRKCRLRFVSSVKCHDARQLTGGAAPDRREG